MQLSVSGDFLIIFHNTSTSGIVLATNLSLVQFKVLVIKAFMAWGIDVCRAAYSRQNLFTQGVQHRNNIKTPYPPPSRGKSRGFRSKHVS